MEPLTTTSSLAGWDRMRCPSAALTIFGALAILAASSTTFAQGLPGEFQAPFYPHATIDSPRDAQSSALSGRLWNGANNTPIADGYVFALSEDQGTVLRCSRTERGAGPDSGSWSLWGLPASGRVVLFGFHPSYKMYTAAGLVDLRGRTEQHNGLVTNFQIPNNIPEQSAGILGVIGVIAEETNRVRGENASVELADYLLTAVSDGCENGAGASPTRPTTRSDDTGAGIILVLDRSDSMDEPAGARQSTRMQEASRAASLVVQQLSRRDELGIVVFGSSASVLRPIAPVGSERARIEQSLASITPSGGTNFSAALNLISSLVESTRGEPPTVLFLSDGEDGRDSRRQRAIEELRDLAVTLHAMPIGERADQDVLCSMARTLGGTCIPVTSEGLTTALGRAASGLRGLVEVAAIRDVIRPGEVHPVRVRFQPSTRSHQEIVEITDVWPGSDLAIVAQAPSGATYSTEVPGPEAHAAGSVQDGFRLLRVPYESGEWIFETHALDMPAEGELYTMTVAVTSERQVSLAPLRDQYQPGEQVELVLQGCEPPVVGRLHGVDRLPQDIELHPTSPNLCSARFSAPDIVGIYAIEVRAENGPTNTIHTALQVGSTAEVVAARDVWRSAGMAWMAPDGSGITGLSIIAIGCAFVLLLFFARLVTKRKSTEISAARQTQRPVSQGAPPAETHGCFLRLHVSLPTGAALRVPLRFGLTRVGRAPDNDFVIDEQHVSRYHLKLVVSREGVEVENLVEPLRARLSGAGLSPSNSVRWAVGATMRLSGGTTLVLERAESGTA